MADLNSDIARMVSYVSPPIEGLRSATYGRGYLLLVTHQLFNGAPYHSGSIRAATLREVACRFHEYEIDEHRRSSLGVTATRV